MDSDTLAIDVVADDAAFLALREEWNSLLARSDSNVVFLSWEWLWCWWNAFKSPGWALRIIRFSREGNLIGICPFYIKTSRFLGMYPLRRALFLGTTEKDTTSDYMDIIAESAHKSELVFRLHGYCREALGIDEMYLQKVRESSDTLRVLSGVAGQTHLLCRQERRYECAVLQLPVSYDLFFAQVGGKTRSIIKYSRKWLRITPDVSIRKTENEHELDADFSELVRLHQLRWTSRGQKGSFADSRKTQFHRAVMFAMLSRGCLELWFLSVAGKNIASIYLIKHANRLYFIQSGTDVFYDNRLSPGGVLHDHCIRRAIGAGIAEYDFLLIGKNDAYKKQWANSIVAISDTYVAFSGSAKMAKYAYECVRHAYRVVRGRRGTRPS